MKLLTKLSPLILLLAAPLAAQMPPPPNPNPAAAQAGTYTVEPRHTRIQFSVLHLGFSDWYGDLTGAAGKLTFDPAHVAASQVDVTIPMASISTTNATLDGELKSAAWFDADQYPEIRFTSVKVIKTGARTAKITGKLTLHGVTRPVTLDAAFNASGVNVQSKAHTIGFNATTTINRSDYGVKTYLPLIGDAVTIRISAAFERAA